MYASGSLRFRSKFAGRFPLGCGSIVQSPWKGFWREPWSLHAPQRWPKFHIVYGSRIPGAVPLSHSRIPEDEVHHPLAPQMILLKIANWQALAQQPATSSIDQNYTLADSRTPLLAVRICPPCSFWGFLEINYLKILHSTMLKYGASHTCAGKLAPPRRLLSYFYSNTTPKAAEQSV